MTCPFCGSDDIDISVDPSYAYECLECGAQLMADELEDWEDY